MTAPVIVWGYGKLGRAAARVCSDAPGSTLAAVVTARPEDADGLPAGVHVFRTLDEAQASTGRALVMHCGHALGDELVDLLESCAARGLDVVTSSGLFDPGSQLRDGGAGLQAAARAGSARISTAGVHPGFVLDVLPALLLDLAPVWRAATVVKPSDARSWPVANRHMQGIGETRETLESAVPYPLAASARLVAAAVGCGIQELTETRTADVADREIVLGDEIIPAGMAVGFQQRCIVKLEGGRVLTLVWHPSVDVSGDADLSLRLDVEGSSWLRLRLDGGFREDPYLATAQRMLHVGLSAQLLPPGLHRAVDVPLAWPAEAHG